MHTIHICQGGSCQRNFAADTLKRAEKILGIKPGESTPDGQFQLETCGCISNCELGPNVLFMTQNSPLSMIMQSGTVENHMTPSRIEEKIRSLQAPQ